MGQKRLYVVLRGGLGNQLFMLASAYALAQNSDRRLQIVTHWFKTKQRDDKYILHKRKFELDGLVSLKRYRSKSTRIFDSFVYQIYLASLRIQLLRTWGIVHDVDSREGNQIPARALILDGYMQNPSYFSHLKEQISELIALDPKTQSSLQEVLSIQDNKSIRWIALHVRRGDNLLHNAGNNLLSLEYYMNCLSKFDLKVSKVAIFSDDLDWCKESFIGDHFFFVEEKDPMLSLHLMSYCDDFIVSPSTFSWWGAWLSESSGKKVIHPKPYNEESTEIWRELPQPDWIAEKAIFQ